MNIEGDVVLVCYQDKPAAYARIEAIEQDIKKDWYQVTFLLLTIPSQTVTWILREEYFNGTPFTMGGNSMLIENVERVLPETAAEDDEDAENSQSKGKPAKVIPFKGGGK